LFKKFFPDTRGVGGYRDPIQYGTLVWDEGPAEKSTPIEYWPPTDARPQEGRIARIHDIPPLRDRLPEDTEEQVVLLLVQDDDDRVRAHYVTTTDLKNPKFNRRIATFILSCLENTRTGRSGRGFIDLEDEREYCHG
jgi:hypothetical protein